jgi:L,D-peptidoglycan transpeptidase YkuD (ErfK/YbiS/YcfS/YnhG family)
MRKLIFIPLFILAVMELRTPESMSNRAPAQVPTTALTSGTLDCASFEKALASSEQVIAVQATDWSTPIAELQRFEKNKISGEWVKVGSQAEIRVGKNGMGWGIGLHTLKEASDVNFRIQHYRWEGSDKSPAGIFSLGAGFGTNADVEMAEKAKGDLYYPLTKNLHCIDDSSDTNYNHFIADDTAGPIPGLSTEAKAGIKSSEHMVEMVDPQNPKYAYENWFPYQMGIFINQNTGPVKADSEFKMGQWRQILYPTLHMNMADPLLQQKLQSQDPAPYGSCIFIHVVQPDGTGTSGCTALPVADLKELMLWREQTKNTLLIQLPKEQWDDVHVRCQRLPEI